MREETETYKIRQTTTRDGDVCTCGHPAAAHGSSGLVCGACSGKEAFHKFWKKEEK